MCSSAFSGSHLIDLQLTPHPLLLAPVSCSAQAVAEIARGCPKLEYLNLTWCVNVDDTAVGAVAAHCLRLKLLSVYGLRGVTDQCLEALAAPGRCGRALTTLDVHGCCNVSARRRRLSRVCTATPPSLLIKMRRLNAIQKQIYASSFPR